MAISPGELGLASFIGAEDAGCDGDKWKYKTCKSQVTANKPTPIFYRLDALPIAKPPLSKH